MVDFRFHLVSLISVFLALAVGIVLGAGPLKESIGKSLTEQVATLRADRDSLRTSAAQAKAEADNQAEFLKHVAPVLVRDKLGGRRVALVAMPGAENSDVADVEDMLDESGAKVTGEVDLHTDFGTGSNRKTVTKKLRKNNPKLSADSVNATLASALARSLVVPDLAETGKNTGRKSLLNRLTDAKLVRTDRKTIKRGTLAVVVADNPSEIAGEAPDATAKADKEANRHKREAPYLSIVRALKTRSAGVVVAGTSKSAKSGLVHELRNAHGAGASTVDSLGLASGPIITVLALREQLGGGSGSYGFADGARAVAPKSQIETPEKPADGGP